MITNESQLIRFLARLEPGAHIRDKIFFILKKDLKWDRFLDNIRLSGVGGLAYKTVDSDEQIKQAIPKVVQDQLRNIYYCTLRRNLIFAQALEENVRLLRAENIELIIFKGLLLAEIVYRDPGMRPMSDIDVMAREEDLKRIDLIFKGIGYSAGVGSKDGLEVSFNSQRNSILYFRTNKTTVYWHLYWHFINTLPYNRAILDKIDMEKIWKDSGEIELGKICLRTFSLYHQVIYLCLHAMQHSFRPLILLCDINELISQNSQRIDWGVLEQEAREFGLAKHLYYGLYFASKIMELKVPQQVLERLKPKKISVFERKFIDSVLEDKPNFYGGSMVYLGMNENIKDRLEFLLRVILPSRKEMAAIRQKEPVQVTFRDYFNRFSAASAHALRFIINK